MVGGWVLGMYYRRMQMQSAEGDTQHNTYTVYVYKKIREACACVYVQYVSINIPLHLQLTTSEEGRHKVINSSMDVLSTENVSSLLQLTIHSPPLVGGLFLDANLPSSFINLIPSSSNSNFTSTIAISNYWSGHKKFLDFPSIGKKGADLTFNGGIFLSLSLTNDGSAGENSGKGGLVLEAENEVGAKGRERKFRSRRAGAMNTTKHLWAGAVAAMVARTCLAPLERLKLEYILRGEKKNIAELVRTIAMTQGLRGFWKGNLLNILRTAPFKAINFCAYDTYRKQLLKLSLTGEASNVEKFMAGAAAGVTATVICLPLDTIRTKLVAPGGEQLGGVIGAFRYMITSEGLFSLYKGLLPSILSIAPSAAVFYGVYDVLKSAFLHSPQGKIRKQKMQQLGQELTTLDQLELGPARTLLYGAISGACAEAATYPLEVLRRQLQMQARTTKLSAPATLLKIVQEGGIPGLYAGLVPSLLQMSFSGTAISSNKLLCL